MFSLLPEDLFHLLQSYLTADDYHYFLNASKKLFALLKRKTIYFNLNLEKSLEYLNNVEFRSLVLSKVESGWKQISLQYFNSPSNFSRDLPVHRVTVKIDQPDTFSMFSHVECLHIGISNNREIPFLSGMKELVIEGGGRILAFETPSNLLKLEIYNTSNMMDVSPLLSIPHIHLGECDIIEDFTAFQRGNQTYLSLSRCLFLTDVSPFRSIRTLILSSCDNLKDVSPLHAIHHLEIAFCPKVTDISGLGDHYRLKVWQCSYQLTGYHSLLNVPHVALTRCDITDLRVLRNAKSLRLTRCNEILDLTPIASLKEVKLIDCTSIHNLSALRHVPQLSLVQMIIDKNQIREMRNRAISFYHLQWTVEDYSFLSHTRYLKIRNATDIPKQINSGSAHMLQHLQFLELQSCRDLENVNGLGDIPVLHLKYCPNLRDITALGRNKEVAIAICPKVDSVQSLMTVPIVTLRYCINVTDYECLKDVPRLKISKYFP